MHSQTFLSIFVALFGVIALYAESGSPAEKIKEIESQYQAAYELHVGEEVAKQMEALGAKYKKALERALEEVTNAGRLEEAVALRDEIGRVNEERLLPENDNGAGNALTKLRKTYRTEHNRILAWRDQAIEPIVAKFGRTLEAYQEKLTKARKLDDALGIKAYRSENLALKLMKDGAPILSVPKRNLPGPGSRTAPSANPFFANPGGDWFDALADLNVEKAAYGGDWTIKEGKLMGTPRAGSPDKTRIEFIQRLGSAYELDLVFRREDGAKNVVLMLPVKDEYFAPVHLAGFFGKRAGINMLKGKDINSPENPTAQESRVQSGREHRLTARVRQEGSEATIEIGFDGQSFIKWSGPVEQLPKRDGFGWNLRDKQYAGLGIMSETAVLSLRLRRGSS